MPDPQLRSRIATLREQAGLTQLELSQKIGVTQTTIANWENSRSGLDWFERLIRLCDALDCGPNDLVEVIDAPNAEPKPPVVSLADIRQLVGTAQPPPSDRPAAKVSRRGP